MTNQEDYLDIDYDNECYDISCSIMKMWYRRARKLQKIKEKEAKQNK